MTPGKILKILLIISAIIVGLIVLLFVVFIIFWSIVDAKNKHALANEIPKLPLPATCKETNRSYTASGVDTVSSWHVAYQCNTTGKPAYDQITSGLKNMGYQKFSDDSDDSSPGQSLLYSFIYSKDNVEVDYNFFPDTFVDKNDPASLHNSSVQGIDLYVKRTHPYH